jgi:hypothetical protein
VRRNVEARHVSNDGGEDDGAYDRIRAGIRGPFVECLDPIVSRNVLLDELLANRLRVHPLAEPGGGDGMERDVFGCPY